MHISEGILSAPALIGSGGLAVLGTAVGLKRLNYDNIITAALFTSVFFVISSVHIPIGPVSAHLQLNGLLGLLLGLGSIPAIAVSLLLQALIFQHGGVTVLGVNTIIIGLPSIIAYYFFHTWIQKEGKKRMIGAFLAGFLSVFLSVTIMASFLIYSDESYIKFAQIVFISYIPLMFIEGFITMFTISFLSRVQPGLLHSMVKELHSGEANCRPL